MSRNPEKLTAQSGVIRSFINRLTNSFSLIEVIMAIGLFSFCVISIFYLLGVGLKSSKDIDVKTATVAIIRELDSQLRMIPSTTPSTAPSPTSLLNPVLSTGTALSSAAIYTQPFTLYFDTNGNMMTNVSPTSSGVYYQAVVQPIAPAKIGALTGVITDGSVNELTGLPIPNRLVMWSVILSYPPPVFNQTRTFVLGRGTCDF